MTVATIVNFFALLIIANMMNRKGIEEIQNFDSQISESTDKIRILDHDIATYSSLVRIEQRARQMGLSPAKRVEYLR